MTIREKIMHLAGDGVLTKEQTDKGNRVVGNYYGSQSMAAMNYRTALAVVELVDELETVEERIERGIGLALRGIYEASVEHETISPDILSKKASEHLNRAKELAAKRTTG